MNMLKKSPCTNNGSDRRVVQYTRDLPKIVLFRHAIYYLTKKYHDLIILCNIFIQS